jgi:hypothetical protein
MFMPSLPLTAHRGRVAGSLAAALAVSLCVTTLPAQAAPSYSATVAGDSPVAYWRLGEAPGVTTAVDASGNGHSGTYSTAAIRGSAGAIVGDADTAASFDGTAGKVSVPDADPLRLNGAFSIELWAKLTQFANSYPGLVVKGSSATADGYLIWYTSAGAVHFKRNGVDVATPAGALTTTGFSHLVVTNDGTTTTWYVNGVPVKSAAATYPANAGTAALLLGMGDQYGAHTVDDVSVYSTALSAGQVQKHYYGGATADGVVPTPSPSPSTSPTPSASPTPSPTPYVGPDPVVAAVGDIACDPSDANYNNGYGSRDYCHQRSVSNLVAAGSYTALLSIGDQQYADATLAKFNQSYNTDWGRFNAKTYPVPGNHEYLSGSAAGYYQYFGARAGDPTKGYYSFDLGAWHIVALNGECGYVGGCGAGSPQETFLKADLAAHRNACTLAYWHEPRFSSGQYGDHGTTFTSFWNDLYAAGAEIVLNGHIHDYERFAPIDPNNVATSNGIREFVVGTGGKSLVGFDSAQPNSEKRNSAVYGILALTLKSTSYTWKFVPDGKTKFGDSGSTSCH